VAKVMSFADKANKKAHQRFCPVCSETIQFVKLCRAVKGDNGAWKMRNQNVGVCKCNHDEIYS